VIDCCIDVKNVRLGVWQDLSRDPLVKKTSIRGTRGREQRTASGNRWSYFFSRLCFVIDERKQCGIERRGEEFGKYMDDHRAGGGKGSLHKNCSCVGIDASDIYDGGEVAGVETRTQKFRTAAGSTVAGRRS